MSRGSITQRGSSFMLKWELSRDPLTQKRRYGYKTVRSKIKRDAQIELTRILSSLDNGTYVATQKMTVGQWSQTWISMKKSEISARSFERLQEILRLHVDPHIGSVQIQKVSPKDVIDLYCDLRKKLLSEQTLLQIHRTLSQCLKKATEMGEIVKNPVSAVPTPKPSANTTWAAGDEKAETVRALDKAQLNELLNGFKGHWMFPIVVLAASTGARRGELLALRWQDIDFDTLTIKITKAVEETKAYGVRFKHPKNKGSRRDVGIDSILAAHLRVHWKQQAEDCLKLGVRLPEGALVFPYSPLEPMRLRSPSTVTKAFTNQARILGFSNHCFHDLRHTHATQLLIAGVQINAVAQRLGHSSPMVTLTIYGHVLKRSEEHAVLASGELLEGVLGKGV